MNTIITPTWVTRDVAQFYKNSIKLIGQFDRSYDDQYRQAGAKMGDTVLARIPQRFTVSEGQGLQPQAILNQTVPITINHQYHVDMGWSSSEATLQVEDVQNRYTMPAGEALANKWDVQAGAEIYKSLYTSIGTPGVPLSQNATWLDGVAKLQELGVPGPFTAVIDPRTQAAILNANVALFGQRYQDYFKTGQFGENALGIDEWFYDPNMPIHTTGTFTASTPVVSSASQTGSTLALSGLGTYAFKAGDSFKIDGVNSVNPVSFVDTGTLQEFSIQADASGSSTVTLSIAPPIIPSGSLQTVTASPALNAAVTFKGATGTVSATLSAIKSRQSFIFNGSAMAFVMADLKENLAGARTATVRSKNARISMRWVEQFNIQTDQNPSRVDTIGGIAPVMPIYALRAWS